MKNSSQRRIKNPYPLTGINYEISDNFYNQLFFYRQISETMTDLTSEWVNVDHIAICFT